MTSVFEWKDRTLTKYKGRAKHVCGIPEWIDTIGNFCFAENKTMESIELPSGLKHVGLAAFQKCTALKSIRLPDSVLTIDIDAFEGCTGLERVEMPRALECIESGTFSGCSALWYADIPDGVKFIRMFAFKNCSSFQAVVIPPSVRRLDCNVFKGCNGVKELYLDSDCCCKDSDLNLGIRNFKTCELYVPKGTVNSFRAHPYFSKFQEIRETNSTADFIMDWGSIEQDLPRIYLNLEELGKEYGNDETNGQIAACGRRLKEILSAKDRAAGTELYLRILHHIGHYSFLVDTIKKWNTGFSSCKWKDERKARALLKTALDMMKTHEYQSIELYDLIFSRLEMLLPDKRQSSTGSNQTFRQINETCRHKVLSRVAAVEREEKYGAYLDAKVKKACRPPINH